MPLYRNIFIKKYFFHGNNIRFNNFLKLAMLSIAAFTVIASSSLLYAAEQKSDIDINKIELIKLYPYKTGFGDIYADVSENLNNSAGNDEGGTTHNINWHKLLGWSTLGVAVITLGSGFAFPHGGHCTLSGVSAALASAACITGFYKYGNAISFTSGKWENNIHAVLGAMATIGFIASCSTAGKKGSSAHVALGEVSGGAFTASLVVLCF